MAYTVQVVERGPHAPPPYTLTVQPHCYCRGPFARGGSTDPRFARLRNGRPIALGMPHRSGARTRRC